MVVSPKWSPKYILEELWENWNKHRVSGFLSSPNVCSYQPPNLICLNHWKIIIDNHPIKPKIFLNIASHPNSKCLDRNLFGPSSYTKSIIISILLLIICN